MTHPGVSDRERKQEREYVRSQLYHGRSPADLHRLVDEVVVEYVRELRGHVNAARLYEAQRDQLAEDVKAAVEPIERFGEHGAPIAAGLREALERADVA